jgi:hypothetical protein
MGSGLGGLLIQFGLKYITEKSCPYFKINKIHHREYREIQKSRVRASEDSRSSYKPFILMHDVLANIPEAIIAPY